MDFTDNQILECCPEKKIEYLGVPSVENCKLSLYGSDASRILWCLKVMSLGAFFASSFYIILFLLCLSRALPRVWQDISITRLTGGGGLFCFLPLNSINAGPIYKIQTVFDRPGKFTEGNSKLLTSGSPMTSKIRSKSKCLTISLSSFVAHYNRNAWK